ncbi:MAG: hypothetical protein Q9218_006919, partial [Villophora microphyllina]
YNSFLETRAQPLIDLSLYLSSENYHTSTRPAYSRILGWPNSWILPPQRRAAAKARTDHLNLNSLDLDNPAGDDAKTPQHGATTEIPKSLRSTQHKVSTSMKQAKHTARFRLDALAESFFEPIVKLLAGKRYLLSEDRITSLDCLALGYLSLALIPELPHPWLSQLLKSRYPRLCHYVEDLARDCYGVTPLSSETEAHDTNTRQTLPWGNPSIPAPSSLVRARGFLENLPLFGTYYKPALLQQSTEKTDAELSVIPIIPTVFVGLAASLAALGSYVVFTGEIPSVLDSMWLLQKRKPQQRLNEMGEAGAMLGAVDFRGGSM